MFLLVVLGLVAVAWLISGPVRARMRRETARIERETVQQSEALQTGTQLKAQEAEARKRLAGNPQDFEAHMRLASALGRQRNYSEELPHLQAAQQIQPQSAAPHAAMGQLFDAGGLHDLAIEELRKAIELDPNDLASLTLLAYKYVAFGWNSEAGSMLTRALAKQPEDVRLHVTLALVNFQTGQMAAAEQHLLTARRLAPKDATVIGPLIEVYRHSQRYNDALKTIAEAMPVLPDKLALYLEKAQVYEEMDRPTDAIAAADDALKMSPGLLRALYIRAIAFKMEGDTASAIRDFEQVRAGDSRTDQTLLLLGQLYIQQGRPEKGKPLVEEYNRNLEISQKLARLIVRVASLPKDWKSHLELGTYYCQGGSYPRAIVELKRSLELKPGQKEALSPLVKALQAVHRDAEANVFSAQRTTL
jgi:tetratricopeptide (TPR) repeat protein